MPGVERLYTMEDVAKITSLSVRTIQNHLKTGILRGRTIGGQWRFTATDIQEMMNSILPESETAKEQKKAVANFMDGTAAESKDGAQICMIVDLYISSEAAEKKSTQIQHVLESASDQIETTYYTYDYNSDEGKARFVLFASAQVISKIMRYLK